MNPDEAAPVRLLRRRLRAGDPEAYASLFRDHAQRVHRLAAGLCGDRGLAEDVVGETFLAAWKNRSSISDTDAPLVPWLLAIAARQSLNATRGRSRQQRLVTRQGHRLDSTVPDIADSVSSRLDDAELLARTRAALDGLRDPEIEVLALCVWSGVSTRDAARALGVAEGTVRSRLSRARARLRALATSQPPPSPRPLPRSASAVRPLS
ncbi:RNA polymerase sigma factor [Nocardioides campestrisoli]|uniref:RNA polymerase sigma factor n=1 Tax=Nocardioides campestrisoli TaxID=2736757 RepID=UPI00163D4500|nr:RNA polymerase sigma factor [Nocardioides campestrisoli]